MQTPEPTPTPTENAADAAPVWLGRWSFGLAFVSAVVYFASSEGMRNFVVFLATIAKRALAFGGHGA
jgi:hypothetical protein